MAAHFRLLLNAIEQDAQVGKLRLPCIRAWVGVKYASMSAFDEPIEPSWLGDLDWPEFNKLRRAYADGGEKALKKAWLGLLEKDALQCFRVTCAYNPDSMKYIEDVLDAHGYTMRQLIDLAKKKQQ